MGEIVSLTEDSEIKQLRDHFVDTVLKPRKNELFKPLTPTHYLFEV